MLREDANGAVVSLPSTVFVGNEGACYVDECVSPGTYHYGCETPLSCATPYWVSATVTGPLDGGCVRHVNGSTPLPVSGPPPWPADAGSPSCPQGGSGGCSTAGSPVTFADLAVLWSVVPLWLAARRRRAR